MKDLSKTQLNKNKDKLLKFRWCDLHFLFYVTFGTWNLY